MQREIKFRAWVDSNKEMVSPYFFVNYENFITQYGSSKPSAVMQFTGLKDKNRVEIYEGDIVDCYWLAELGFCEIDCQHKGVVRFVDCRFVVSFSDKAFIRNIGEDGVYSVTELELTYMSHDEDFAVEYEVIGNIYENPELINS